MSTVIDACLLKSKIVVIFFFHRTHSNKAYFALCKGTNRFFWKVFFLESCHISLAACR